VLDAMSVRQLGMLIWPWPDPGQGQGHGAFVLPKISKAVHAGNDDRQPPCGDFWFRLLLVSLH